MKVTVKLLLMSFVFLYSSCASKPEDQLIGKWNAIAANDTVTNETLFEFYKNGNVGLMWPMGEQLGTYQFLNENRLKLEFNDISRSGQPLHYVAIATLKEDVLSVQWQPPRPPMNDVRLRRVDDSVNTGKNIKSSANSGNTSNSANTNTATRNP